QKGLLDSLFEKIEGKIEKVLDLGSGRTSIFYLTDKFKNATIKGVVYPGDNRKIDPIKECIKNKNYQIVESDIKDLDFDENYDVVLAHLFLGEAEKFAENKFEEILDKLFKIKTKYLVLVNLFRDNINYNLLLKKISQTGDIVKVGYVKSEGGEDCVGLTIKFL
ncbi:MAG: class I SAM-dependent methyltransferase, partial [Patescibacteria group bacterium]